MGMLVMQVKPVRVQMRGPLVAMQMTMPLGE